MRKKIGDPSCTTDVKKARRTGCILQGKCAAHVLGNGDGDEYGGTGGEELSSGEGSSEHSAVVDERLKKRQLERIGMYSKK